MGNNGGILPRPAPPARRRVANKPRLAGAKRPPKVSVAKLRELRATANAVRVQVASDRDQITAEARTAVADTVARGRLTKLTLLLRPDEQAILDAWTATQPNTVSTAATRCCGPPWRGYSTSNSSNPTGAGRPASPVREPRSKRFGSCGGTGLPSRAANRNAGQGPRPGAAG